MTKHEVVSLVGCICVGSLIIGLHAMCGLAADDPSEKALELESATISMSEEKSAIDLALMPRLAIEGYFSSYRNEMRPVVFFAELNEEELRDLRQRVDLAGFPEFIIRMHPGKGKPLPVRRDGSRMFDNVTTKPAAILDVTINKVDHKRASGTAHYYVGPEWAHGFNFECEKRDGKWVLTRLTGAWVS